MQLRRLRRERLRDDREVVVAQRLVRHPHSRGEQAEDLAVGLRLADRGDRRPVERHVVVTVGEMQVPVLELRRRREHDVGPVGGVGLEVLQHHGEEILARQPAQHGVPFRSHRRRIAVVHDECLHGRATDAGVWLRERVTEADHVDRPRGRAEVRTRDRGTIELEVGRGGQLYPATRPAPVTGDGRQAGDVAHRHPATRVPLQPVVHADEGGPRTTVSLTERNDDLFRQSRHRCCASGRPLRRAPAQRLVPKRVALEEVPVLELAREENVHEAERQRAVGAGADRQPLVALQRGPRLDRIDADDRRAARPRLKDEGPEVWIGRERVGPPQQHEVTLGHAFAVGADVRAHRHAHADGAGHRADRAIQPGRAE